MLLIQSFPGEFGMYLNYCKGLKFDENPDYMYLRQLFRVLFRMNNHQYDFIYDWSTFKKDGNPSSNTSKSKGMHLNGAGGADQNHATGGRKTAKSPGRTSNRKTPGASPAFVSPSPGISHKQSQFACFIVSGGKLNSNTFSASFEKWFKGIGFVSEVKNFKNTKIIR